MVSDSDSKLCRYVSSFICHTIDWVPFPTSGIRINRTTSVIKAYRDVNQYRGLRFSVSHSLNALGGHVRRNGGTSKDIPCAAPTATLLMKQNPDGVSSPQWCPGGLTATKARSQGSSGPLESGRGPRVAITLASTASHTAPMAP